MIETTSLVPAQEAIETKAGQDTVTRYRQPVATLTPSRCRQIHGSDQDCRNSQPQQVK